MSGLCLFLALAALSVASSTGFTLLAADPDTHVLGRFKQAGREFVVESTALEDEIVSEIGVVQDEGVYTLSRLHIPAKYLNQRMVPGLRDNVVGEAKELLRRAGEVGLKLGTVAKVYDRLVHRLYNSTHGKDMEKSQVRFAPMYHLSVALTAQRLGKLGGLNTTDPLCTDSLSYLHGNGLFSCEEDFHRAVPVKAAAASASRVRRQAFGGNREYSRNVDELYLDVPELYEGHIQWTYGNIPVAWWKTAQRIARKVACGSPACRQSGCEYHYEGWFIRNTDYGCCSVRDEPDRNGCCRIASLSCFIHSARCSCCVIPYYCGWGCIPDPVACYGWDRVYSYGYNA
ncbi:PREDICTED: uncharacterized protein LOC109483628 [Branchiostoma belcheri]|uniref:Uncharacterized protein LOC109483628 n=1 Tax=Branchiostoma belcheri TaxID=7741 RepID=A0A6P5AG57_BRABE|nr:PREDICTED: uncharacterized protein LOC109483628 [Branchiostoma belcheri]